MKIAGALAFDFARTRGDALIASLRIALVTVLAMLATLFSTLAIDPEIGPGVLAVVLSMSLARSHLDRDLAGRIEAAFVLPAVGLVAIGVGMLLLHARWLGASVFVAGMFTSIWLRRFGARLRRAGALIALPFIVILTTPYVPATRVGPWLALMLPVIVALLALLWVALVQGAARYVGLLPRYDRKIEAAPAPARALSGSNPPLPAPPWSQRIAASTRMATQMAVALALAFVVGYAFFAERWAWIVLTALIVNLGNRGRLDVIYKGVLRVLGAGVGTLAAFMLATHLGAHDATTVALMLAALFFANWLRPFGYGWWALFVTLALALLQDFAGIAPDSTLTLRWQEIVIGAVIGVAAAWFVLPVRSTDVLRRRIADALAALSDALDPANTSRSGDAFAAELDRVAEIAPAFVALRAVTSRWHTPQPADWIDALLACRQPALAMIERGEALPAARKAVGAARKALREPASLKNALHQVQVALAGRQA